jgi:RNA-binding protein YhbY
LPLIPIIENRVNVPAGDVNAPMNIGAAGIVGQSIEQFGKTGMAVNEQIATTLARQQEEKDHIDLVTFHNQHDRVVGDYKAKIAQNTGELAFGAVTAAKADLGNIAEESLKNIPERLIPQARNITDSINNSALDHIAIFEQQQRGAAREATIHDTINLAAQNVATSDSPFDIQNTINKNTELLQFLDAHPGVINTANAHIAFTAAQTLINKNDLVGAKLVYENNKDILNAAGFGDNILAKLKTADKSEVEKRAFLEISSDPVFQNPDGTLNYKKASSYILSADAMKKYNFDLNQAQNINQSLSLAYATGETQKKDLQSGNMESLYTLATKQPGQAMRKARELSEINDGSVDPKELYTFQKALETHIKQNALMSAQERQIRIDMEDKGKAAIKVNILANAYKDEKELINAVLSAGFSNTNEFVGQAVTMFRKERTDNFGQVNNFKNAQEDWQLLITTTKSKTMKRELKDKQNTMENTLAGWMLKNNIPTTDPKVMEQYKIIKKNMTETWTQKQVNKVYEAVGFGEKKVSAGDSFITPVPTNLETYPVGTKRHRINPTTGKKESQEWNGKEWTKIGR